VQAGDAGRHGDGSEDVLFDTSDEKATFSSALVSFNTVNCFHTRCIITVNFQFQFLKLKLGVGLLVVTC